MTTLLAVNNYHYYRGGAETVYLEHSRLFEQHNWRVVSFAMQHQRNLPSAWSQYFIDEIEFGEKYSFGQQVRRVPRVVYSLQARQRLRGLLDATSPDICHAHNIYHHISPSILGLLKQRGIPVVLTLHDLKVACPAYQMLASDGICERCRHGRLYNVVRHRCIKGSAALSAVVMLEAVLHRLLGSYRDCVDRFVVPSRFYASKLVEWGLPAEKFRHVPNFVTVTDFQPEYRPGQRLLYFGRLAPEKGLHTLVRATAAAQGRLSIAGTGPELESLQRLAAESGADVMFLGYLSGQALHSAVRDARAVVLASEWYENAPMSVLEAYALGKPVVGARIGGIPELVRDGVTGFQFESGDVASLSAALERVALVSDARLAEMGREGRAWVTAEFSAQAYRERMLAIYREVGVGTPAAMRAGELVTSVATGTSEGAA